MRQINLQCPINQLGYGIVGLNLLKALQKKQIDVTLFPIGEIVVTKQEDANAVQEAINKQKTFNPAAPCIKLWHENALIDRIGRGKYFGFPIFELDTFDDVRLKSLDCCDEILVCSEWAKNVVLSCTNKKTHVVPLGVDTELFNHKKVSVNRVNNSSFVFLNVGKWEIRKGHDVLIKAFQEAFPLNSNADVTLAMLCNNPFPIAKQQSAMFEEKYSQDSRVLLLPRLKTQEDVVSIMSQADAGIFPSRAEGWNLELLEMMSLGKPVIATNYSGHTEFVNEQNCNLIEIQEMTTAFDGIWFNGIGKWASIGKKEISELAEKMLKVYNDGPSVNINGIATANMYTWENTANKLIGSIYGI